MCTVHDGIPELARLSRLRKSQIKGLLVPPPARAPASSTVRPCACAFKLGLEGIISKRLDSPYCSGRSQHWVKSKNPAAPAVKRESEEDWGGGRWRLSVRFLCRTFREASDGRHAAELDCEAHAATAPRSNSCPVGCSPGRKDCVSPSHPFERFHRCPRFDNALLLTPVAWQNGLRLLTGEHQSAL